MGADEDAASRRERLSALRAAKELLSNPDGEQQNGNHEAAAVEQPGPQDAAPDEDAKDNAGPAEEEEKEEGEAEDDGELPAMKFRNYLPRDEQLRGGKLPPVTLPKFEDPIAAESAEPKQLENPFGNIAPKNPNWDLKRDVQKRVDKLEKRTQKALAEIALEQQREKEALEEAQD